MTESEYIDLLQDLGVIAGLEPNSSRVLKVGFRSLGMYFHRNSSGVYFWAKLSDSHFYPDRLWRRLDTRRYKSVFRLVPWPGMERDALRDRIQRGR